MTDVSSQTPTLNCIAVIPARYASTRFPGKPLACETGKPLIQHVVERTLEARLVRRVIVATDDQRIADAVHKFDGEVCITGEHHPNGTSRIAEVLEKLSADERPDIIVNVQGDEPEIEPDLIDQLILGLERDANADMATLASPFAEDEDPRDPNIVKILVSQQGRALYFSRSLVPYCRDPNESQRGTVQPPLKHPGLYAYRSDFLPVYVKLPPSPLEQTERLEQLRAIEHGHTIAVVQANVNHHGIDTPQQYREFVNRVNSGS